MSKTVTLYRIIWPDNRLVSGEQLIRWAKDSIANNQRAENPETITVGDAIEILSDEGEVTFGKGG